jgi:cobyrinic acid a,c-diamide synthase
VNALLVAARRSGVGKTTIALAIMAPFNSGRVIVQPFKCGPDIIDGGHHSAVCGRASRNLDTGMLGDEENQEIFFCASSDADFVVVEGMMGQTMSQEQLA